MVSAVLRLHAVIARTGLSRSTIYSKVKQGEFPPPINLGVRAVGWLDSEVDSWLESRVQASRQIIC
ncbi:MAG: AlpA family transcriptional regulator [Sterolibacterium sp.]